MTNGPTPHGRGRYQRGCRCGTCTSANREYQRRHRTKQFRLVTPPPADVPPAPGPVEIGVRAQLEHLASAQERPGVFAVAVQLAAVLDNQSAIPQHASAARVLTEIIMSFTRQSRRPGRLTAVRSLTERE